MNTIDDVFRKVTLECQRLRGEAVVMRGLLTQCANVMLTIDSENDDELDMLDDLNEKIAQVIRAAL